MPGAAADSAQLRPDVHCEAGTADGATRVQGGRYTARGGWQIAAPQSDSRRGSPRTGVRGRISTGVA